MLGNADIGSNRAVHSLLGYHQDTDPLQAPSLLFQEPGHFGWMGRSCVDGSVACVSGGEGVLEQGVLARPWGSELPLYDLRQVTLDFFGSQFSHL